MHVHLKCRRMEPDYLAPLQGDLVQPWVQLVLESVPQLDGVALQHEVDVAQTDAADQEARQVDVRKVLVAAHGDLQEGERGEREEGAFLKRENKLMESESF